MSLSIQDSTGRPFEDNVYTNSSVNKEALLGEALGASLERHSGEVRAHVGSFQVPEPWRHGVDSKRDARKPPCQKPHLTVSSFVTIAEA